MILQPGPTALARLLLLLCHEQKLISVLGVQGRHSARAGPADATRFSAGLPPDSRAPASSNVGPHGLPDSSVAGGEGSWSTDPLPETGHAIIQNGRDYAVLSPGRQPMPSVSRFGMAVLRRPSQESAIGGHRHVHRPDQFSRPHREPLKTITIGR
jgi:hypothetical protein